MRPEQFRQVRRRRDAKEVVSEVERAQRVVLLEAVAEVRQALCCINVLDVAVDDGKVTVVATNIRPESADVPQLTAVLSACRVLLLSGQRGLR